MNQQFRNVVYLSDRSGTGKWRRIWPIQSLDCISQGLNIQTDYSQTPIIDQNYYRGMTSVTVQRWISDQQREIFTKLLRPVMDQQCGWLVYEIDDNMASSCIPKFNRGRAAFEPPQIQENIRVMLNTADFVTVTTDYLKNFYHNHYGVPMENIIAIPNLLPKYLFGDKFNPKDSEKRFGKNKNRPRIGIVSSLSHYNIDNVREDQSGLACRLNKRPDGSQAWVNEHGIEVPEDQTRVITDDIDAILDCIRETVNDVQWVFFGFCPPKLQDLADAKKIEVHGGVPIMNYASYFHNLGLQAVVAAINKTEFNFCKSPIKFMECAALGVPCFATKCEPYSKVMPEDQLFDDGRHLKELILRLKASSTDRYRSIIDAQWKWLNSPHHEGDFDVKNFWLEDNLNIYVDLNRLRQKGIGVSLKTFSESYTKRKEQEDANAIHKDGEVKILK